MRVGHIGTLGAGIRVNQLARFFQHGIRVNAGGLEHWRGDAAFLPKDGRQQVRRADIRVAIRGSGLQGFLQRLLCLGGGVKRTHVYVSPSKIYSSILRIHLV